VVIFRLVFGGLLLAALLCFAMYIGTQQRVWMNRGLIVLKWTVLAGLGASPAVRSGTTRGPGKTLSGRCSP